MKHTNWDAVFTALEDWRDTWLREHAEGEDPAVSTIAEHYSQDPWAVLASTILSLRTKDETTLVASRRLLEKYPTMEALVSRPAVEIEKLIYPVGFYHTKAENLKRIAKILIEENGARVPDDMDALLALPGVGRKTANLVLSEAYHIDAICVDTHVHRISNRAGWLDRTNGLGAAGTKSPEETEMVLREKLPQRYWQTINKLLVFYGQQICRPISPRCSVCVIAAHCERRNVERSR
jgi:endonuclease-3